MPLGRGLPVEEGTPVEIGGFGVLLDPGLGEAVELGLGVLELGLGVLELGLGVLELGLGVDELEGKP